MSVGTAIPLSLGWGLCSFPPLSPLYLCLCPAGSLRVSVSLVLSHHSFCLFSFSLRFSVSLSCKSVFVSFSVGLSPYLSTFVSLSQSVSLSISFPIPLPLFHLVSLSLSVSVSF